MLTFDFSAFEDHAKRLDGSIRQIPFVISYALTNAMKDARKAEIAVMESVFDRPTRYTLNALQVVPATKTNLRAELRFKEFGGVPAWKYLSPHVSGGKRRAKGFERLLQGAGVMGPGEFAVPGRGAPRDGNGNVSGAFIKRMLSALGASSDATQNTKRRPKRGNRKRNLDYFVIRSGKAAPGIYLRQGRVAVPVMIFVASPSYKARFPYYVEARRVIPASFRKHFYAGFERFVVNDLRRGGLVK